MSQLDLGLNLSTKRTRKREFLDEMTRVVGGFNRWMQHNIPKSATVAPLTGARRCRLEHRHAPATLNVDSPSEIQPRVRPLL
jgi:hypothetical protein